jgi:serine/threonine protein kinase
LFYNISNGKLRFNGPKWDKISNEAKHFILRCLDRDANTRITASEMLEHPFIKRLTPSLCPIANKNHVDVKKSSAITGNTKPATDGYISKDIDQDKLMKLFASITISDAQLEELEHSGALDSSSHSVISSEYHMDSDSGSQEYGDDCFMMNAMAEGSDNTGFYLTQLEQNSQ